MWRALLDMVFPRSCAGCGAADPDEGRQLCWDCLAGLAYIQPPFCASCGDPVSGRIDHAYRCPFCASRAIHFDTARSVARYDGALAVAIQDLKYRGALWLADDLARLLESGVRTHFRADAVDGVAPVPLHPTRRRERGYNQAAVLAGRLARRLGRPLWSGAVRKIRWTPTQTRLTAAERMANVAGSFASRGDGRLRGRNVLLVDDVMTTGATVNECARALKAGGAAAVWVITVARG